MLYLTKRISTLSQLQIQMVQYLFKKAVNSSNYDTDYDVLGYDYTFTRNRAWSKTRSPRRSCYGVDMLSNFDDNHCEVGVSTNPCSSTYCGRVNP